MYIKLNFTANKQLNYIFRAVHEIINDSTITSIATLQAKASGSGWHSTILASLDATNSSIIRTGSGITGLTSNTVSHYAKNGGGTTYTDDHDWTVQFSVFDASSTKYYVQHKGAGAANSSTVTMGTTITGTFATNQDVTSSPASTTSIGSTLTLGGTPLTTQPAASSDGSSYTVIRTFFMYISDTCMVWGATASTSTPLGMQGTYSNAGYWIGPFIYSQYDRFDYHNSDTNSIIPLMFTNVWNTNQGFIWGTQTYGIEDGVFNGTPKQAQFRVLNLVNAYPNTSVSYPIIVSPSVNWGVGSRFNDYVALTTSAAGTSGTLAVATYGAVIFTSANIRYPTSDLKEATFAMLPISWRNLYYYNTGGGDASSRGGWYLFNGDYFPGDEFTYNNKTYIILPTWSGYTSRLGLAIPKE